MGLSVAERNHIEGLLSGRQNFNRKLGLTEEQQISRAIARLAANPPPEAGKMQRCAAKRLIRPYPLGLRLSGKNMSPLPGWLGGCQNVCLNFSDVDLAVQCHFALFNGSAGFVLKPPGMLVASPAVVSPRNEENQGLRHLCSTESLYSTSRSRNSDESTIGDDHSDANHADNWWPPPRERLARTTIEFLSLHNCPKRGEKRPRHDGRRGACHKYHPELSGGHVPPNDRDPSVLALTVALHPIGGELL